jgi:hypothetical protein
VDPRTPPPDQDEAVLRYLRHHAERLAQIFELPLRSLHAESPRVRRRYGVCFADGTIKLRLRSVRTGELLRESSLVDTLCHELAHLRHLDHSRRFHRLYERILAYARRHGIYRPGAPSRWPAAERAQPAVEVIAVTRVTTVERGHALPERRAPLQLELF